jgi:deoxyribose-phosphate aldolase
MDNLASRLPRCSLKEVHMLNDENRRIASAIDHTKLMFSSGEDEQTAILQLCKEACLFGFYAVCVRPRHITWTKAHLQGSSVKIATVIGFPLEKLQLAAELKNPTVGKILTAEKMAEAKHAVQLGTDELDWVISVADLKADAVSGTCRVLDELKEIRRHLGEIPVKVIIETDLLSEDEIVLITQWCSEAGMTMVKTSTGMLEGGLGATLENIEKIAKTLKSLNSTTGIKASGGIKTREQAILFLNTGVNRLGTSSGVSIMENSSEPMKASHY